ncbi:MAG: DUF4412 domain-containing protein [Acidobacteriota bacterium]
MKNALWASVILSMMLGQPLAGVVVEMVSRDLRSNQESPPDKTYLQNDRLRIEPHINDGSPATAMIFRDNTLFILTQKDRTYIKMNEQTMGQLGAQINSAMKQMQEQLANLPPEQRAMMEQMMKGQMPDGLATGRANSIPSLRIVPAGTERVEPYSCDKYEVYQGQEKTQEICVVPVQQVAALGEVMDTFRIMARFTRKMVESTGLGSLASMTRNPFQILDEIDGFPVLTRYFQKGQPTHEVRFKAITQQDLSDDLFSVPTGYREIDPFARSGQR